MSEPYYIKEAVKEEVPIILSIPHSGTEFPDEVKDHYLPEQLQSLDDTDWFLHDLYHFAPSMGITVIHAKYSRWLIDLNRDPASKPLYEDGRIITGLTPKQDFKGNPIYKTDCEPDQKEVDRRIELYYKPYYKKVRELLEARKEKFGKALLWDAHSIRQHVPTIRKTPFPEMILGNNDGKTADKKYIDITLKNLSEGYQLSHNDPFKGGHITRYFGDPENQIHALQLERNKNLYMDDAERKFDEKKANRMREVLEFNFEQLIEALRSNG
ncbi:MAG: N-formylglutamate amidohydrolase [Crocinitomicaceae bacterium]